MDFSNLGAIVIVLIFIVLFASFKEQYWFNYPDEKEHYDSFQDAYKRAMERGMVNFAKQLKENYERDKELREKKRKIKRKNG